MLPNKRDSNLMSQVSFWPPQTKVSISICDGQRTVLFDR